MAEWRHAIALVVVLLLAATASADPVSDANAALDALNRGDNATAVRLLTQALQSGALSQSDRELAYVKRAEAYAALSDVTAALADIDQAVILKPGDKEATGLRTRLLAARDAPAALAQPPSPTPTATATAPLEPGATIYDTLKNSGRFTILVRAIDEANLMQVLQAYPNLTFFAPTDAAFNSLPPDLLSQLMAANNTSANQLQQILKYHLINAQVYGNKIEGEKGPIVTVEGTSVTVDGDDANRLLVDKADILQEVHSDDGGVVYVIDKVLIPSDSPFYAMTGASASRGGPEPSASP